MVILLKSLVLDSAFQDSTFPQWSVKLASRSSTPIPGMTSLWDAISVNWNLFDGQRYAHQHIRTDSARCMIKRPWRK